MTEEDTNALLAVLGGLALQGEQMQAALGPHQEALQRLRERADALSRVLMSAHPGKRLWLDPVGGAAGLEDPDEDGAL